MRLATGSWRVLCERAYGVRREASVCDVRGYTPRALLREAGVYYVREHTACDGKLACTMCVSWDGKLACAV